MFFHHRHRFARRRALTTRSIAMLDLLLAVVLLVLIALLVMSPAELIGRLLWPLHCFVQQYFVCHVIGTGVNKRVYYKVEATWNTAPGTGSGQALRRVSSNFDLKKDTFESNELVTHL